MAKTKKTIFIVLAILGTVFLLSVLQIVIQRFNNPMDQPAPDIVGNACLIWGAGENESAVIPAQASLTRKHYVFANHEDGICLNSLRRRVGRGIAERMACKKSSGVISMFKK